MLETGQSKRHYQGRRWRKWSSMALDRAWKIFGSIIIPMPDCPSRQAREKCSPLLPQNLQRPVQSAEVPFLKAVHGVVISNNIPLNYYNTTEILIIDCNTP